MAAEEEGFEPSVPRSGTPVFETGPINHSGTPPSFRRLSRQFTKSSAFLEEFFEHFATFIGQDPRGDRDSVVEARVGDEAVQALAGTGLGIGRAIDKPREPALNDRAGAHRTGLESHVQGAIIKPPRPDLPAGPG